MTLFLVQHGEAKPESEDPDRSLTDRGVEVVERMADWAARMGMKVDEIRHSGKRRAEQTATIFAKRLNPSRGMIAAQGLTPLDSVDPVAASLQSEQDSIMIVGHLPHLSRLVSLLVSGDPDTEIVKFRNAGIVCLFRKEENWAIDWVMQPDLLAEARRL
jgi:phosphohistidine phosphatase